MFYVAIGIVSIHTEVAHFRFTVGGKLVCIHEAQSPVVCHVYWGVLRGIESVVRGVTSDFSHSCYLYRNFLSENQRAKRPGECAWADHLPMCGMTLCFAPRVQDP